jgi:hypothetical protein
MLTAAALVASIFLNGVNIDGLRGQSFERCRTVKIDDRGDVHLDCPAYQVEQAPTTPAQPAAAPAQTAAAVQGTAPAAVPAAATAGLSKHYWLVTEQSEKGAAQYELDLWINSKWVRKFKAGEDQVVLDVTKFLQPGANKFIFASVKKIEGTRRSASPSAYIKAIVGEGESGGNNVMIDNVLLEVKRTAAELDNKNEEFTVNAR